MPQAPGQSEQSVGLQEIEGLSEKQRSETLAGAIMPTCLFLNTVSVAFWYQPVPSAHDTMTLYIHTLLPRELAQGQGNEDIAKAVEDSIKHIHMEDISVNEGIWRGMHAPLAIQGPLSLLEESIWQLNQWWVQRVVEHGAELPK